MSEKKISYGEMYKKCRETLENRGVPEADLDARLILDYVCGTTHHDLLAHGDMELAPDKEKEAEKLISLRAERIPLSQLTGQREFMGLDFHVTGDVLTPRQDTETLVEEALILIHDGMRFMDICTGSGCVALSILNYTNDTAAVATDISESALEIASENADRLLLTDRIRFEHCDLFPDAYNGEKFDMIVSNPPYIRTKDIDTLEPEVRDHEPRLALDGGEDGLCFIRRIAEDARRYLYSDGWLLLETGFDQGKEASVILKDAGYREVEIVKDLGGKDRVVKGCWIDSNRSFTDMRR